MSVQGHSQMKSYGGLYWLSSSIVEKENIFTAQEYFDIIIESFRYFNDHRNVKTALYCIMPNHLHWMFCLPEDLNDPVPVLRDFKRHTAKLILMNLNLELRNGPYEVISFFRDKKVCERKAPDVLLRIFENRVSGGGEAQPRRGGWCAAGGEAQPRRGEWIGGGEVQTRRSDGDAGLPRRGCCAELPRRGCCAELPRRGCASPCTCPGEVELRRCNEAARDNLAEVQMDKFTEADGEYGEAQSRRGVRKHQVWNEKSDLKLIENEHFFLVKENYCHTNPLQPKWQLVERPEDYPYSSCNFYINSKDWSNLKIYNPMA